MTLLMAPASFDEEATVSAGGRVPGGTASEAVQDNRSSDSLLMQAPSVASIFTCKDAAGHAALTIASEGPDTAVEAGTRVILTMLVGAGVREGLAMAGVAEGLATSGMLVAGGRTKVPGDTEPDGEAETDWEEDGEEDAEEDTDAVTDDEADGELDADGDDEAKEEVKGVVEGDCDVVAEAERVGVGCRAR